MLQTQKQKSGIVCALLGAALLDLSACVDPARTGPAGQDASVWQTRGCIDKDLQTCVANIGGSLAVDQPHISPSLAEADKIDLNGKHVVAAKVTIPAYIPDPPQLVVFDAYQDQAGIVRSVNGFVSTDLFHAVSAEDFRKSGLFPVLSTILGSECPSLDEAGLAQLFYNDLKPRIVNDDEAHRTSHESKNTLYQHIPAVALCGHMVSFIAKTGTHARKSAANNLHGEYAETMILVK